MNRFLALLVLSIIGGLSYNFMGFEQTVVILLILIYWAMPMDKINKK